VIAQGSIPAIEANAASRIGPFLAGKAQCLRPQAPQSELFALGRIQLSTNAIHTVKPLDIEIPKGRLTVVTGVSGSGKTTLVLESLVPGMLTGLVLSMQIFTLFHMSVISAGIVTWVLLILSFVVTLGLESYIWPQIALLDLPLYGILKNSLLLFLGYLPRSLGAIAKAGESLGASTTDLVSAARNNQAVGNTESNTQSTTQSSTTTNTSNDSQSVESAPQQDNTPQQDTADQSSADDTASDDSGEDIPWAD